MTNPELPKQNPKGLVTVPTSLTALTTTDTQVFRMTFANAAGSTRTILVTDGNDVPLIPTVVMQANTNYVLDCSESPAYLVNGVKWQAGGASVTCAPVYWYK